jgi:hypothetical protein
MAVLLNQTSNLRVRLELIRRLSDGVRSPAALEMRFAVERYAHAKPPAEHGFLPLLEVPRATLLDMDLIAFLQQLEEVLDKRTEQAAFEASVEPAIGLRILRVAPETLVAEAGVDLLNVLETVGGSSSDRGSDLMLVRFATTQRATLAFCAALLGEFGRFPTDPSKVHPGEAG